MKKQTSLPVLFLLFFFTLGLNKAKAHPGDSCSNPIIITPILAPTITDYLFVEGDSVKWFSFIAPYSRLTIETDFPANPADTPRAYIDSLIIYKGNMGCGSLMQVAYSTTASESDTLPSIQLLNFDSGYTYFVKVTRYRTGGGCHLCPAYFGLDPILLPTPIIPPPANCPPCGPNLLCNGNFEDTVVPLGYQNANLGACYQDDSYTYPNFTPPPVGISYCIQSPTVRYGQGCSLDPGHSADFTDIYLITDYIGSAYHNSAVSGSEFMMVDAPSTECSSCSVGGGTIPTPLASSIAWEENVGSIPGATYQFSCWLRDADVDAYPGATVSININGASPFFSDIIDDSHYNNWTNVSYCWSASASSADIQLKGQGDSSFAAGYDYEIDSLTYTLSSLPAIAYTPSYTICMAGDTLKSSYNDLGSPYLSYSWSPGTGLNSTNVAEPFASPTVTTTYTCTISTTQGTCTETVVVQVVNSTPTITITSISNDDCFGQSNGSASVSASGGNTPYIYLWTPTSQTNATATGLTAGSYTVAVTDSNGCMATASVTITQPAPITITFSPSNPEVCGPGGPTLGTTSVTAIPSGGTPAYTYLWNNRQTTATATGLAVGTYKVKVKDANGCTASASVTVTSDNLNVSASNVTVCSGSGSLTAQAGGGILPYTYLWTPTSQTSNIATGLSSGTYTVTVTDSNGCTATASGTVSLDTIKVNISTGSTSPPNPCVGSIVTLTANTYYGSSPYTYSWSNTATTASITYTVTATPVTYTVTVTDANGCTATASITITPDNLSATATVTANETCYGGVTGSASANVTGGISPFTYLWAPHGGTNASATGLSAGVYTVTVTDHNDCTATANVTITQPSAITIHFNPTNPQVCGSSGTTSDTAHVSGGTPAYTYSWSNGQTTSTATGLHTGAYTFTVTDAHGCTSTASVSVTTDNLGVSITNVQVCSATGSLTATASNGSSPYTYLWAPNGQTTATISGLSAGTYSVTVTDANGCTTSTSITINPGSIHVTLSGDPIICSTGSTGGGTTVITAHPSGGYSPYTYSWTPSGGTSASANLSTGTYTVTVTDLNGCTATASIRVRNDLLGISITNPNPCTSPGSLQAIPSPGIAPYTYLWAPHGQTTATITGLSAGSYMVTVTDSNGCKDSASYTINRGLQVTLSGDTMICLSTTGGSTIITAHASGGYSPYTYLWSPGGATTSSVTITSPGTYAVTLTDSYGCTATASITTYSDFPSAGIANAMVCSPVGTTSLTVVPIGGYSPYTYLWSTSPAQTNITATGLSIGSYTVTVTDAKGCSTIGIGYVSWDSLSVSLNGPADACLPTTHTSVTSSVSGGISPYTYSWSTSTSNLPIRGSATNSFVNLILNDNEIGGYVYLTVTDANGCSVLDTFLIRGCCGLLDSVGWGLSDCIFTSGTSCTPFIPNALTIANGSTVTWNAITQTWIISNFTPNDVFDISGTIIINANTTIECSDVRMASMARIIVRSPYTLTIENCHFHGCPNYDYMWDKIGVAAGASVVITGSLMEEAQNTVYIQNGTLPADVSNYYLYNTIFNKDSIGVEVLPYPYPHPGYVASCTFSSDASAGIPCFFPYFSINRATPISQIDPNTPNRGAIGMVVRGVKSLTIGDPTNPYDSNVFIDIDCGIYTEASSPTVFNARFWDMTPVTGAIHNNPNIPLAGIYAKGGAAAPPYLLTVGSTSSLYPYPACHFTHCQYGVWGRDTMTCYIRGNYFEGYPVGYPGTPATCYGVYLLDNLNTKQMVSFNSTINDYEYGVGVYYNGGGTVAIDTNLSITSNANWPQDFGIYTTETGGSAAYSIIDNTIRPVENGISCLNLTAPQVILNTITISGGGPTKTGIIMNNCDQLFVKRNTVTYGGTNPATIGISLYNGTPPQQVKCNTLNYPYTGLSIYANQAPITIEQNSFNMPGSCTPVGYGIYLTSPSGYIGINPITSPEVNTWSTCTTTCGGAPQATYNATPYNGNEFIIPAGSPCSSDPPIALNGGSPRVIFITTSNTDSYNCLDSLYSVAPPPSPHDAFITINDSIAYIAYPQTSYWQPKYNLYNYMYSVDSSLVDSSTVIQHFFDSTKNANIGKIVQILHLLNDTNGVSGSDLTAATSLNTCITSPDTAESIYKSVFGIMIAMNDSGGQFIPYCPAHIACLEGIAPLCPAQYGTGVYLARALLSQIDTTTWLNTCTEGGTGDEEEDEHKAGKRASQTNDSVSNLTTKVYPNPANTVLNVEISGTGEPNYIYIYNSIGQLVLTQELIGNLTTIPVSSLAEGIYHYRIIDKNQNPIKTDNLLIVR